ncbi:MULTISPECIES: MFS transporter [Priestia]|uniref:MFS transporter n=1 Tax=Priestia megaterium TaxID=1404 RepID=A0A1Q8UV24_PRIMG|nr:MULTISPECIES: MFS transporter [Priestia]AXI29095.1 MFS transporter [Priestia megaterium]MBX9966533.1 MFS transporter [Priestia aryabhattai]MBZ6487958.1 MFS transporter [Priestia aryabhattai]MCM3096240.1 MFS transporter [Priestia megaterium]MDH3114815.1 MFS transporter [Priestia aryabhattai]
MQAAARTQQAQPATIYRILFAISLGHFLNDCMQSVIPALFPVLEKSMNLNYTQIGWIAFALNMTSSIMQPVFGVFADKRPSPFLLPIAMCLSMIGMVGLALAPNFYFVIISVLFVGFGSAIFHPEGSRVAYMAAGGKRGLAQSIYQVGGNTGQSMAPLFTAFIFIGLGQFGTIWFTLIAGIGVVVLYSVSKWYKSELATRQRLKKKQSDTSFTMNKQIIFAVGLLIFLVFARSWYGAGILNFFQFYIIEKFNLPIKSAQLYVFLFMIAGVFGTFFGGPLADRFGKRNILLFSMLGSVPFTLLLPHVSLGVAAPLLVLIGFILQSSFSVTVVYAQELMPGKIGLVSGLIVGLAFGMGALGAVVFGKLADVFSLQFIMLFCSYLPILGLLTWLLPSDKRVKEMHEAK